MPTFHHIHLNAVDPERSLEWYSNFWPRGKKTVYGGFPAFYDDIYLLYNKVSRQAPGGFDPKLQRSVPQSAFWTFGSTVNDTVALVDRLSRQGEKFLPVYTGPDDDKGVLRSALGPYGDQLLTLSQLKERATREKHEAIGGVTSNQDFGYLVDPDGMLVEFNKGEVENFWGHQHYWHEQPLCAANWYVEHLGMQLTPARDPATGQMVPRPKWNPCEVPIGEVSYPSFIRSGQLRIPIGSVRFANGGVVLVHAAVPVRTVRAGQRPAAVEIERPGRGSHRPGLSGSERRDRALEGHRRPDSARAVSAGRHASRDDRGSRRSRPRTGGSQTVEREEAGEWGCEPTCASWSSWRRG